MNDGRQGDQRKTARLSSAAMDRMRARLEEQYAGQRFSLLIYHRDGVQAVPLLPGRRIVVGRFPPSDVVVRDASLSAEHAALELDGGAVWVEDLGSTNGTRVDGEHVERSRLQAGSELLLGAVVAAIHAVGDAQDASLALPGHDRLSREVEIEIQRARATGGGLTLVMLRHPRHHASRWLDGIRGLLRPFDRAALYAGDTLEVLMPAAGPAAIRRLAEGAVDLGVRAGCAAFPDHAATADELVEVTRGALQRTSSQTPLQMAGEDDGETDSAPGTRPVVRSPAMQEVFGIVDRLAAADIPVLILGETGSGKEVLARAIHEGGPRRQGRLVCINCGGIPSQLVESTLFGHERGAFTGAERQAQGVFDAAQGGTVLLDEIGELPAAAQSALLRILESKRYCRVGSTEEREADVRILAATHRDLEAMCDDGGFRRDLFYRLEAMTLRLPPLRERIEEIDPLTRRFLDQAGEANGRMDLSVDEPAMALLHGYGWPGNVRELRNAIERAVVIARDDVITADDLPAKIRRASVASAPFAPPSGGGETLKERLAEVEARWILEALQSAEWERKLAATALGLPLRTLAHKMQVYGIRRRSYDRD